jgi:flagellin
MSFRVQTNIVAINAARNLGAVYSRLSENTRRLSSGLRIESAADDPVNLVVRELMRTDIAALDQGLRNASDGLSMLQTAEGALAVIDEKLIRMKELAEQAATGTYTTIQREIMNSEYQTMAAEIDRIAEATDFNGTKLLDGSLSDSNLSRGLKIHFGAGNEAAEDYYFANLPDVRATTSTGLKVGGDARADIFRQRLGLGVTEPNRSIAPESGPAADFLYYYNYDASQAASGSALETASYLAGIYRTETGDGLTDLIQAVNRGTASRVEIDFTFDQKSALGLVTSADHLDVCLGDEVYQFGSGAGSITLEDGRAPDGYIDASVSRGSALSTSLVAAVNANAGSKFWGVADTTGGRAFFFAREAGNHDDWSAGDDGNVAQARENVTWTNVATGHTAGSGASFSLGGRTWARAAMGQESGEYFLTLEGAQVGPGHDLMIGRAESLYGGRSLDRFRDADFDETQNAGEGSWVGAEIRTQSAAQASLDQLTAAISKKDEVRALLGFLQIRLENTTSQLSLHKTNIMSAESRISDLDVAAAMTSLTRDQVISQAGVSVVAQANSYAQLALHLIV